MFLRTAFRNSSIVESHKNLVKSDRLFQTRSVFATRSLKYPKESGYQYLQEKPVLSTYHFQESLPRLPIPPLEQSIENYLDAVEPILSNIELGKTKQLAEDFLKNDGKYLHKLLVERDNANKHTSYISGPWFDMYLRDRQPLPINYNPGIVLAEDPNIESMPINHRQLVRTTNLVVSSLRFFRSLSKRTLEPEVFHLNPKKSDTAWYRTIMKYMPKKFATYASYMFQAYPLDMSQYDCLFRFTRIPRNGKDIHFRGDISHNHIILLKNGNMYSFDVLDAKGDILPIQQIMGAIDYVLKTEESAKFPVGIMTTQNRDEWAKVRDYMISRSNLNLKAFHKIDTALFVLCLDDAELGTIPETVTHSFLHGYGENRWFDKSLSLISSRDGWAGVNFEHSWGDGVAVMRFFNEIYKDSVKNQWSNNLTPVKPQEIPAKLSFQMDQKSTESIGLADEKFKTVVDNLFIKTLLFENFGRKDCKKLGISPDFFMQLGFQVAAFRMFGETVGTYESCSTAAFKHGRTEALRPATKITKDISKLMAERNWADRKEHIRALFVSGSKLHTKLTKAAATGQGFDRHLYGLKYTAQSNNIPSPSFFEDEAYKRLNYNILSTSTLSSPAVRIGSFGPVVPDGFGIGYQIWEDGLGCVLSCYKNQRDGQSFIHSIEKAFTDLKQLVSE